MLQVVTYTFSYTTSYKLGFPDPFPWVRLFAKTTHEIRRAVLELPVYCEAVTEHTGEQPDEDIQREGLEGA